MTTIEEEPITHALLDEMMPMFEAHRQELTAFKDIPLKVDKDKYVALNAAGAYHAYIARSDSGDIVGYVGYMISPNLHYADYTYAMQDVFYVDPSRRGVMIGLQLLRYADDELKKLGVSVVTQHSKLAHDFKPLMDRLGYNAVETIYMKRID
jgi:L-amino acid N-acyltransferase YncA